MNEKMPFIILFFGILLFATLIGGLTGLSSSPVITTVVPLIFSVFTAGGIIYVLKDNLDSSESNTLKFKAKFIGLQLIAFAVGFSIGTWGGVQLKLTPDSIWTVNSESIPAYGGIQFSDVRLLSVLIKLDKSMIDSGLSDLKRKKIFKDIELARNNRSKNAKQIVLKTNRLLNAWSTPEIKNTHEAVSNLREIISELEYEMELTDEKEKKLELLKVRLARIATEKNINFGKKISELLSEYQEKIEQYQDNSLLHSEEVKAIELIIGKKTDESVQQSNSPFGRLIVDVGNDNPFSNGGV